MDSLSYLQEKLSHLIRKYPNRPRYSTLRMFITSINALFISNRKNISFNCSSQQIPCIIFAVKGGLGDLLIACNYIYCFYKYVSAEKPIQIKIQYHSLPLLKAFCEKLPGVVEVNTRLKSFTGNLQVELVRFPRILAGNPQKLANYSPRLNNLLQVWEDFFTHNRKFFDFMPQIDGLTNIYSKILGNKRINQADLGGLLFISDEYQAPLSLPDNEAVILSSLGIVSPFITLNRGQGLCNNELTNVKLWPIEYYNQLISLLKKKYKKYQIVQLGTNTEGCNENFQNIDVNLLGKTNLDELKVVLKNAKLHVDSEGGLVHLRHALKGGPSVVLFGPTSPSFYDYRENLNLRSDVCPYPCEWVTNDWVSRCIRHTKKGVCMQSLTPQFVFEQIQQYGDLL